MILSINVLKGEKKGKKKTSDPRQIKREIHVFPNILQYLVNSNLQTPRSLQPNGGNLLYFKL